MRKRDQEANNNSVVEVEVVLPVEVMTVEALNKRSRSLSPPVIEPVEQRE